MILQGSPSLITMRVAFYCHFWLPYHYAGSEVMAFELAKALKERGHEIRVVADLEPNAPESWVYEGIQAVRETTELTNFDRLAEFAPDIVITHHNATNFAATYAKRARVPLVQMTHNKFSWTDRELGRGADFVIHNTEILREHFEQKYSYPNCVLHPPVFPEEHATTAGDMYTLINMCKDKGSELFYDLVARNPEWDFLAVEGGHSTQNMEFWPNVSVQRQTRDMKRHVWSRTNVLLVPSAYESYGLVAVEALASGIPVIAHPTDGLQESLSYAGVFADREDTEAWERALSELRNPEKWQEQSEISLKRSRELHPNKELDDTCSRLEQLHGLRDN